MTWYLRFCPVCRGDLTNDDWDPKLLTCLLCGRSWDPVELVELAGRPVTVGGAA